MPTTSKLSVESFLGLVKQSGLIDPDLLKKTWKEMKEQGIRVDDPVAIAGELVGRNLLTRWQADKLLQGKHKGFFLGKYRLLSHLGSGGMSAVYLAEHILMRRRVAIKVLPKARVNDSSYLERFHREAQAVAALDHRNIVRAYDVDQEDKNHFLVMEYVPGQSLHELVARHGPVDFVSAAEYMRQAAEGLQHAHRIGMVHRDIKPGNLLLDEKGTVKLLDLGLARFFDDKEENSLTVKHDEKVLGTADYLSPEQALDSHKVDIRSDIYSLGCTLYFLLTGHPPFSEGTLAQRLLAHQTKRPRSVQEDRPDMPASLVAILEKMMAKKPEDRYQSARETANDLLEWLNSNGGSVWERMNPAVGGSSQLFSGQSPGASSVLTGDPSGSSKTQHSTPPIVSAAATGGNFAEMTQPGSDDFAGNPFAAAQSTSVGETQETSADPALAAFLSNMSDEQSTRITRSAPAAAPEQTAVVPSPPPAAAEFEPTVAIPSFPVPDREPEPAATEVIWPQLEASTFEATADEPPTDIQATLFSPPPETAAPVEPPQISFEPEPAPPARPPVAAVVAAPVAAITADTPVARPVANSRPKPRGNRGILIGVSGALVILLGFGGYWMYGRGAAPEQEKEVGKSTKNKKTKTGTQAKKKKSEGRKVAEMRGEFSVGPTGKFKTIGQALSEIKQLTNNKSKKAVQIIKVASGQTYPERIAIDESYPRGIQIVAEPGTPPILAPSGSDPIVTVRAKKGTVDNFHLEGFQLDAAGKEVAVELSEWNVGTQLERLEITGFGRIGIFLNGAQTYGKEDERIILKNITFRNGAPAAVGMLLTKKTEDPRYIRINQCRFLAPLDCGVRVESSTTGIEISESIFFQTVTGARFEGEDRSWRDAVLAFNTFYENDRAIVFTNMPAGQSGDLGFYNNLFVGSKSADAVVEKDFKVTEFLGMYRTSPGGSGYNWTTRPRGDAPKPGEIYYLFETAGGEFGRADLQFVSTDPASPDFLAPAPASPHRQVGTIWDTKRFGTQIGAVRPK